MRSLHRGGDVHASRRLAASFALRGAFSRAMMRLAFFRHEPSALPSPPKLSVPNSDHNVLNRLPLLYPPSSDSQELVFGGRDARQIGSTTHCAAERLAWLGQVGGVPRYRAGSLRHCARAPAPPTASMTAFDSVESCTKGRMPLEGRKRQLEISEDDPSDSDYSIVAVRPRAVLRMNHTSVRFTALVLSPG